MTMNVVLFLWVMNFRMLSRNKGIDYFGAATRCQYDLSKQLWDLLVSETDTKPTIAQILTCKLFVKKRSRMGYNLQGKFSQHKPSVQIWLLKRLD